MNKKLWDKFNSGLKIFADKMEESKQEQEQILEVFESNLEKENENLEKSILVLRKLFDYRKNKTGW